MLLVHGQSFDSKAGSPAFVLDKTHPRGVIRHRTYFYLDAEDLRIASVSAEELTPTPSHLSGDMYRQVAEAVAQRGLPEGLGPPPDATGLNAPGG